MNNDWEKEFDDQLRLRGVMSIDRDFIKFFISSLLVEQKKEIFNQIVKAFGLKLEDLPAFPPKDDLIGLVITLGIAKQRKEMLEKVILIIANNCQSSEDWFLMTNKINKL